MEVIHSFLPTDSIVIDSIKDEFYDAIQHLKKQDVVGLALTEPESDRYGSLEWLSVSTPMCTFIFDIQTLGKNAFLEGLKTVLENPLIIKILHDCRRPSDCLYHQYDTKLSNVYDTQVADFVVNIQKSNPSNVSKTVNNLYHCLEAYLQIPEEIFHPSPIKSEYSLRPILENVKDFLIKNVIYLRLLKKELDIVLRIPYRRCVDIYMQSILRKSDGEMKLCPPDLGSVPPEMLIEGMQVYQITEQLSESNAFLPKKGISTNEDSYIYGNGNIADNICKDFDRTEVIKFLMERMFYGRKLYNGKYANSIESDQCSVKSMDVVSSLCDPMCPTDCLSLEDKLVCKKEDMLSKNGSLSSLSKIKKLTQAAKRQCDSKLLPTEHLSESDTSIDNVSASKTTLVRQLKQSSALRNVDEDFKNTSLSQHTRNSAISNTHSKPVDLEDKSQQLKEVHNLIERSSIESLDRENPISIITSKDISPSDKYKYVMSKRSKSSSKNSCISDSNDNFSSKDVEKSNITKACDNPMSIITSKDISPSDKYKYVMAKRSSISSKSSLKCNSNDNFSSRDSDKNDNISNACEIKNSENSSMEQTHVSVPEVLQKESITTGFCSATVDEHRNIQNVTDEDPWETLRSAFDSLGPQKPIKKSIFIPAGMNY